jgi:outer membrane protein assembly factor BamB
MTPGGARMVAAQRSSMLRALGAVLVVATLGACASGSDKPKPAELAPNAALLGVRQAWAAKIGEVGFALDAHASGGSVGLASSDGTVAVLDAATGREQWRATVGAPLAAGVGGDGTTWAVITRANEVVALQAGRVLWRQKIDALGYTAPLVAGGRVFVLAADRAITAYDGQSGRKLWTQNRPGEPLVLRQPGVLMAVGNTLVAGLSGRLAGLNPDNGSIRWEAPIASPRGTNDIERLVDLVERVSRDGDVVCARAFQAAVGCVNTSRGNVLWTKPANGFRGVHGDDRFVYGAEADGTVTAWKRADGERAWSTDRLKYRTLTAPLAVGRSVAVGDGTGLLHLLSREDGAPLNRLATDGSAIVAGPTLAGDTLVVVTRSGGVFGFRPE